MRQGITDGVKASGDSIDPLRRERKILTEILHTIGSYGDTVGHGNLVWSATGGIHATCHHKEEISHEKHEWV